MTEWIDLVTYAAKYGVSQSTLRRRIRSKIIPYKLEKGKYYLSDSVDTMLRAPLFSRQAEITPVANGKKSGFAAQGAASTDDAEVMRLREENRQLKGQIAELQTFIKALEAELDVG
ncbi:MAG TPA: hypothetical protein VM901_13740 [Bdellovibrionota bacterium]|jgi:hypothetical protein|nr:hypothetical protein [Bdellovibrionota bacterium]